MSRKISIKQKLDFLLFSWIINWAYPEYFWPKHNPQPYYKLFFHFLLPQKILRINGSVKWPVHFTSTILNSHNIKKGIMCDPGDNPNVYIEANNGIVLGSNVGIGAGSKILSSIHSHDDHSKYNTDPPIVIGNNVFIGANTIVLRSIKIGDNVVIGAGSLITKDIPSNSIAFGSPCKVVKELSEYKENFSNIKFNKKIPNEFLNYFNKNDS